MVEPQQPHSFGVFKLTGHVVISLPSADHAELAELKLQAIGLSEDAALRYTDIEMLPQVDTDRQQAGMQPDLGQEETLVLAHRSLAERGFHWLVVHAAHGVLARQVADVARDCSAERALAFGRFVIEDLIQPARNPSQPGDAAQGALGTPTASLVEDDSVRAHAPVAAKTKSGRRRSV